MGSKQTLLIVLMAVLLAAIVIPTALLFPDFLQD